MRILCVSLMATVLSFLHLYGQGITGAITGVVTDPTGAVVPVTTVTVRNMDNQPRFRGGPRHPRSGPDEVNIGRNEGLPGNLSG